MTDITEQIWKDYNSKLHAFIRSRVSDPSTADDILQDVFTKIYSRIDTLSNENKIQGWIYQITRNAIIDHYRSLKKMDELPESIAVPEPDPGDQTRQEIGTWFEPMMESLPEHYREALMLSEIEGLTQKEVALRQGISLSGAKSRVQRGRSMLKDILVDCCRFEFDHQGNVIDYEERTETCDKCSL